MKGGGEKLKSCKSTVFWFTAARQKSSGLARLPFCFAAAICNATRPGFVPEEAQIYGEISKNFS
jgi:hypothetical protein